MSHVATPAKPQPAAKGCAINRQQRLELAEAKLSAHVAKALNKYPRPFNCVRSGHSFVTQEVEDVWAAIRRDSRTQTKEETFEAIAVFLLYAADCLVVDERGEVARG